jgi:hypothetical protein
MDQLEIFDGCQVEPTDDSMVAAYYAREQGPWVDLPLLAGRPSTPGANPLITDKVAG